MSREATLAQPVNTQDSQRYAKEAAVETFGLMLTSFTRHIKAKIKGTFQPPMERCGARTLRTFGARALLRRTSRGYDSVAMTLSHWGASVEDVASRHVIRCGQPSQLRSLGASPPRFHVNRRECNSCFAGAWSLRLAMDSTPAGPAARVVALVITRCTSFKPAPFLAEARRVHISLHVV